MFLLLHGWQRLCPSFYKGLACNAFCRKAFPLPNQEATTVARTLVDEIFMRFSTSEQLHYDQGRQFEGQLIT